MIAKIAIFLAVVAFAYGGVVVGTQSIAHSPASTVKLANVAPIVTYAAGPAIHTAPVAYAAGPIAYSAPAIHTSQIAYASGPVAYSAPAVVAGPAIVHAPVAYSTGAKVVQTFEPVEQHGYKIAY